jgi:sec-independent protein translocase protein TatC
MFFMNYTVSDTVQNTISLNSYISLFTSMVFLIGLLFEFPTVVLVLSHLGLLTRKQLRGFRKSAFVVILILAALITPSDPFSMFVLSIPLYGLYEFSILVCKPETPSDDDLPE